MPKLDSQIPPSAMTKVERPSFIQTSPPASAFERLQNEVSTFTGTLAQQQLACLNFCNQYLLEHSKLTSQSAEQTKWQGACKLCFMLCSATCAIAGAAYFQQTASGGQRTPTIDPRNNAHDGMSDMISNALRSIASHLSNDEFMSSTCKTAATFFDGFSQVTSSWFEVQKITTEDRRTMTFQIYVQTARETESSCEQSSRRTNELMLNFLSRKKDGG